MNYLQVEPVYVTSLEEVFWGGVLMAITMTMHGFGMLWVLRVNHGIKNRFGTRKDLMSALFPVILASCMIMFVHLTEVMVWALFFLWKGAFPNRSVAYFFSLNEYTTVGSSIALPLQWRLLGGMLATAGLLAFAWSTGILFTMAKEFQDQRMELFRRQNKKNLSGSTTAPINDPDKSDEQ